MRDARATLNHVLVALFHHILRIEERSLHEPGVSIREAHVIEAVCGTTDLRMTSLAQALHITMGSLSVAVSTLERKGYLLRERTKDDRRVINIRPTAAALRVQEKHKAFHKEMVDAIVGLLDENRLAVLVQALNSIDHFLTGKEMEQP
ncbi:MAG: MarR family winged helix-turn-helix transcriptional regulator [Clostridia bacterium]|nr:MarR family winged helix-turn-helix transcriptional regulator [Clostridia bacterium]